MAESECGTYSAKLNLDNRVFLHGDHLRMTREGYRSARRLQASTVADAIPILLGELRELRVRVRIYEGMPEGCTCGACTSAATGEAEEGVRLL